MAAVSHQSLNRSGETFRVAAFTSLCLRGSTRSSTTGAEEPMRRPPRRTSAPHGSAAVGEEQTKVREIWFTNKMRTGNVRSATKEEKKVHESS